MNVDLFLQISIHLTGFNRVELLGTGMLQDYFNYFMKNTDVNDLNGFVSRAESVVNANCGDDIAGVIKDKLMNTPAYKAITKNIITLWYLGGFNGGLVNSEAYVQSLIFRAAQTHPGAARQPGFGSWSKPPIGVQ